VQVHARRSAAFATNKRAQQRALARQQPQLNIEQIRLLASLGEGGFLTWRSSPHVMLAACSKAGVDLGL
jgi:hypothetical protein